MLIKNDNIARPGTELSRERNIGTRSVWHKLTHQTDSGSANAFRAGGSRMGTESPNDIDRASIEEHAQRTTEQTALRKVRKTLDHIEAEEERERRMRRYVVAVCVVLALIGAWFISGLLFGDRGMPKQPPMKVPATLPPRQ